MKKSSLPLISFDFYMRVNKKLCTNYPNLKEEAGMVGYIYYLGKVAR